MIPHYKDTSPISEQVEYEYVQPKYGSSTTDPTYYEPTATRIANMRKSASSGKSLYDFQEGENVDVSEFTTMFGRKPYMTNEEVAHQITQNKLRMQEDVKNFDEEQKEIQKQTEIIKKQTKAVKDDLTGKGEGSSVSE